MVKSTRRFLIGIPFTAFAVFWTNGVYQSNGFNSEDLFSQSNFFLFWGFMFIGFGIAHLITPLVAYFRSIKTLYFVTNQRACIYDFFMGDRLQTFNKGQIANVEIKTNSSGGGDIVFYKYSQGNRGERENVEVGFLALMETKKAEEALIKLQQETT